MGSAHLRCDVDEATEVALLILQAWGRVATPNSQALHLYHLTSRPGQKAIILQLGIYIKKGGKRQHKTAAFQSQRSKSYRFTLKLKIHLTH